MAGYVAQQIRKKQSWGAAVRAVMDRRAAQHAGPDLAGLDHYDLVPAVNPGFDRPEHLSSIVELLAESRSKPVRVVIAAPPQHGKTRTITSEILARLCMADRERKLAFATYSADKAEDESYQLQMRATELGIEWSGNRKLWGVGNNRIKWVGAGGGLTGHPVNDLAVIDDLFKDRKEAYSPTIREHRWNWFTSVLLTRDHPGTSIIVVATRWHDDDLSGRLVKDGWRYINLRAVENDDSGPTVQRTPDSAGRVPMPHGVPLWPERRSMAWYEEKRYDVKEYVWSALFQGSPQPRTGKLFKEPQYYRELPRTGYRFGHGVDLAYTAATSADHSVKVTGCRDSAGVLYVTDVVSLQVEAPEFALVLRSGQQRNPGPMLFRGSGTEKGTAQFMRKTVPQLRQAAPRGDKKTCALDTADEWNAGRILLPDPDAFPDATWVPEYVDVMTSFTGIADSRDDEVDATVSLHEAVPARRTREAGGYRSIRKARGR